MASRSAVSQSTDLPPAAAAGRLPRLLSGLTRRQFARAASDTLEPSLYRFIIRYSLREQLYLAAATLLSFPILYLSLDLPKLIVNDAIGGKHFPHAVLGVELGQVPYLLLLCGAFLGLVVINGWFKF